VYGSLSARAFNGQADATEMIVGFGAAGVLSIGTLVTSVSIAIRRLQAVER
jgi:hypothetical protein